ncbi:uncharacterized protein CMC5_018750 [Chondromyces crocatus]|uniref:YkgJ family cysteine cluster protein n=2 Tax=Chondromyces crocatus TaxID=52 RepID=A0A0K1EAY7_CHOCO|nr:uncharacterized protein CMC5_018750 [Chondromyces crocatus]
MDGEERVILHDTRTGGRIVLDARTWGLLACADGTRDVEGILTAAAREGAHARIPALRAFLEQLHAAGLIDEGAASTAGVAATTASAAQATPPAPSSADADPPASSPTSPERLLDVLPDFTLHCDGRGSCCRIYPTILFAPAETARARAALPLVLDAGDQPARAFLPEQGTGPCAASAVALDNGRCVYLQEDTRCGIHTAAGATAKPFGCRLYPAALVDDGQRVRVSVLVECSCVLASVDQHDGAPILPGAPRTRADLDPALHITELPRALPITTDASAPRDDVIAWSRALLAAPPPADVPASLWALAAALERSGPCPDAAVRALSDAPPLTPSHLAPWIEALAARVHRRASEDAAFRSPHDLAQRTFVWLAATTRALLLPDLVHLILTAEAPPARRAERFHLRAALHGHQFLGPAPLAHRLRDAATRLIVARAMTLGLATVAGDPDAEPQDDPASEHPLALLEAVLRGHGLAAYASDVDTCHRED